ncbi:MAG: protein-glutamate O-methyltransferase [Gammaproteobacteria bacterium]
MSAVAEKREFIFTDQDFDYIRELVYTQTGIDLSEGKRDLVYNRMTRRLRALAITSFSDYTRYLKGGNGEQELSNFINAITTNLTSFYREMHHFEYLGNEFVPELMKLHAVDKRIRIWSAGCSTGEEPYSLAMTLREAMPSIDSWDVKILATDLDSNVIETGRAGVYSQERVEGISNDRLKRWFKKGSGENAGKVKVHPDLQSMISFRQLNLMKNWPVKGPFDLIMCRNVVIYFDKPTQTKLFSRFANYLSNSGRLFVGHSESLAKVSTDFELIGKTVYKKSS